MSQLQWPFFPPGVTEITPVLAFGVEQGQVTYFNSTMPVFVHGQDDLASFRMITAQFCVNGNAKPAEIARAFGIPASLRSDRPAESLWNRWPNQRGMHGRMAWNTQLW